jgi:hypothetical protein
LSLSSTHFFMRITCILRSRVLVMSALAPKRRRIEHNPETRARLWREWEATHEPCPLRRLQNNPGRLAVFVSALDALKRPACVTPPLKTTEDAIFDFTKLDSALYPVPVGSPISLGPSTVCISEDTGACGIEYIATIAGDSDGIWCKNCEMWLNGSAQWEDHKIGKKHKKNVRNCSLMLPMP